MPKKCSTFNGQPRKNNLLAKHNLHNPILNNLIQKIFSEKFLPNLGSSKLYMAFIAFMFSWSTGLCKQLSRSDQIWNLIQIFDRNKFDTDRDVVFKKKDTATIFKIYAPNRISVELTHIVPRWFDLEHQFWKLWPCLFFGRIIISMTNSLLPPCPDFEQ